MVAMILSVDPGRVKPGISLWGHDGKLINTYTPCFQARSAEKRLEKIWEFINDNKDGIYLGEVNEVIIESNSIAAGKEIGCFMAGIYSSGNASVRFVMPYHVAKWAEGFYNIELLKIPRNLKKKRTKELMEILTGRENLTFDESDSILNYFYVKNQLRHRDHKPKSNRPDQPVPGIPL